MNFVTPQYIYLSVVFLSAAISAVLGAVALISFKKNRVTVYFSLMMFMVAEWQITSIFVCLSQGDQVTMHWIYARYVGLMLMVPLYLVFALHYTGYEKHLTTIGLALIFIIPVISILVTCTNGFHGLMIRDIHFAMDGPILYVDSVTYGTYFWAHTLYSYLTVIFATILFLQMAVRSFWIYQQQAILLIVGVIPTIVTSILDAFLLIPEFKHALSPFGFGLMGVAFFISVYRGQLLNVAPIAKDMLIENMEDGMIVLNEKGVIVDVNPAAQRVINIPSNSIIGRAYKDILLQKLTLPEINPQVRLAQSEISTHDSEGKTHTYDFRVSPIQNRKSQVVGRLIVLHEISKRKKLEEELRNNNEKLTLQLEEIHNLQRLLQEQAIRDPLTGLFNRRYLNDTMYSEVKRAQREQVSLCVLILDIDHFKWVNDTFGHSRGDVVLNKIGELLTANVRSSDLLYRYGGEEFLILMMNTALEVAGQRAETIRSAIENAIIMINGESIRLTISIGIAAYPEHGTEIQTIIDAADKALYIAKRDGRNRVICLDF